MYIYIYIYLSGKEALKKMSLPTHGFVDPEGSTTLAPESVLPQLTERLDSIVYLNLDHLCRGKQRSITSQQRPAQPRTIAATPQFFQRVNPHGEILMGQLQVAVIDL